MELSQNQPYHIGPYTLTVVQNLLRVAHRGHAVYLMRAVDGTHMVCKIATNPEAVEQMEHEERVLKQLVGIPGIVRSLGLYPFGDYSALLVEYIPAQHVARGRLHVTALPEHRSQTWPAVLALMTQGVTILQQVHAQGIIHADIKLQNFLYTPAGNIFLADWDHSLMLPAQPDKHIPAEGTPQFMAPEQVRHELVDARTDIYSLGVSCVGLLYGAKVTPRYEVSGQAVTERDNSAIVKALRANETVKTELFPQPLNATEAVLQTVWRQMVMADINRRPGSMKEIQNALPDLTQALREANKFATL